MISGRRSSYYYIQSIVNEKSEHLVKSIAIINVQTYTRATLNKYKTVLRTIMGLKSMCQRQLCQVLLRIRCGFKQTSVYEYDVTN